MTNMTNILFICLENACRSQMAQGFCNVLADDVEAESAGTRPSDAVDDTAVQVMAEAGVDISGQRPKQITMEMNDRFDVIVTMGCIDGCPVTPGEKTLTWDIEDPRGKPVAVYRRVRDDIRRHVEQLLNELV
ncbi:MAG: arsenate reductase ArsC [Candidatus Thermoplasmatota archaeon]|nr:arsenate reductase ArsC [Candidatus Thermoplasmatota archaeon]